MILAAYCRSRYVIVPRYSRYAVIVDTRTPAFSDRVVEVREPVLVQSLRLDLAVEAFDEGIVRRMPVCEKFSTMPFMLVHTLWSRETHSLS